MRNNWNIRVYHLPDRSAAPWRCHICEVSWTMDFSQQHENLSIKQLRKQVYCPKCGRREFVDFMVPHGELLWRDDE